MVLGVGVHALFGARKRLEIDTPQLLVGNPVIPSGRRPFTKHKAPKPKTKQSHRIVCAMAKKKCKGGWEGICAQWAGIFGRRLRRGRGGNAQGAWNEIPSGFVVTAGVTTKPDAAVASRARSNGKSARVSARSWCAAQCAHKIVARCAPHRRQQHDTARSTSVKHAQTRFRMTPAPSAPCR